MKIVLVLAHDDAGQESRFQVALDVTRALDGHLTCIDGVAAPVAPALDPYGDVAVAERMADECQRDIANAAHLKGRLAREDVAWNWIDGSGFLGDSLDAASALADLIVVSIGLDFNEPAELRRLAGHLANRSRRPILAVPQDRAQLDIGGTALIAWNGSRQADEALRVAVPILKLSSRVILFAVDPAETDVAPSLAAQYLSRHGIHARIELGHRRPGETICQTILAQAHAEQADYVVMGAYGHSRGREAILGGVTRSMLARSDLPLLLAHR